MTSKEQKEAFKKWLAKQTTTKGTLFKENVVNTYTSALSSSPARLFRRFFANNRYILDNGQNCISSRTNEDGTG